jgi:cysteine desulfurase / selenocysteine lyase
MKIDEKIIYFDNAATSWPKPDNFINSIEKFLKDFGGNPGRSGHRMSIASARAVEEAREKLATLFNIDDTSRIIFTKNATESLNLAINGFISTKDNVIISSMEHNSVARPIRYLEAKGLCVEICPCDKKGFLQIENLEKLLKKNNIKLVIICHVSNVTGTIQKIKDISEICKKYGAKILLDASQSAGAIEIDSKNLGIDMLAFTGHKELLGPQGTGGIYITDGLDIEPLLKGGTGSKSDSEFQPDFLPDKYESGTLNAIGIYSLSSSLDYIMKNKDEIFEKERDLIRLFIDNIKGNKYITIYGPLSVENRTSVISFNINNLPCSDVSRILDFEYGIMSRPGLHCSPLAHKTIGTFPTGTVRFSFNSFNSSNQIYYAIDAIEDIIEKYVKKYE